jgi:hypothetical protein
MSVRACRTLGDVEARRQPIEGKQAGDEHARTALPPGVGGRRDVGFAPPPRPRGRVPPRCRAPRASSLPSSRTPTRPHRKTVNHLCLGLSVRDQSDPVLPASSTAARIRVVSTDRIARSSRGACRQKRRVQRRAAGRPRVATTISADSPDSATRIRRQPS